LLQHELRERFPGARVFMDLDSIEAGLPFAEVIGDAVGSCAVLVALIGHQWVTLADEEGNRRLDNPGDFVRFEVQTALERGVRVIPVLIDGARPVRRQELPSGLQELAGLNALELSYGRYEYDAGRLLDLIQRVLAAIGDREEADRKAQDEAERQAQDEADRKARQEQQRKARQEAARKAREKEQRKAREKEQRKARQEAQRKAQQQEAELKALAEQGVPWDQFARRDRAAERVRAYERLLGPEHPVTLTERRWLAVWTGRAVEAAPASGMRHLPTSGPFAPPDPQQQRRAAVLARDQLAALLPVRERVSGPDDPETLRVRDNLAEFTGYAGDAAGARDQYAALLPIAARALGPEHPDTLTTRADLAYWTQEAQRGAN
jgi:hypothetical protein